VALTRCPSVVIFILLQHRPGRLIGLQYGRSAFISVSPLVNIPVDAFGRGLPIILSSCAIHSRQSGNHLSVVVSTVSRCHSVTVSRDAVRYTIWYVQRSFSVDIIALVWSSHHLSGALAVALIILQVGALVGTLNIRRVLGARIISNCTPVFLRVCFPLLLQVCSLSLVWVSTSSVSEFTCHFIWLTLLHMLVDSASNLFKGTLID